MDKQQIGDYRLIKQIGQGSLGTLYIAEHRFVKKQYALKVLPPELSEDRGFIQRFEKEVGHLAALDHPHLVKVHDICFADGCYFLVTDCIVDELGETTNLGQYLSLNKERLTEQQVVFLLSQIAECLDYLHEKKITHQNLKLSNILVSQKNGNIHLYLSDVALSHIVGMGQVLTRTYKAVAENLGIAMEDAYTSNNEDSAKQRALHQSFVQNYAFLAPEQKINQAKSVKTDIYAFGILAYYLIMRILPEGFFPLPSKVMTDYKLSWDYFFYHTLQSDPLKRASLCSVLLQELAEKKAYSADADKNLMQWSEPKCLEQVQSAIEKKVGMSAPQPVLAKGEISRPTYEEDPGAIFQADTTVAPYRPEQPEHIDIEPIQTEMVVIHGDEFKLGSDDGSRDERPVHKIRLSSFAIDIHPVINEQFVRFLEAMGGEKDRNNNDIIVLRDSRIRKSAGSYHIESGYSKHPVVGVTWYGAVAYAKWVGKRLPTEAEWEIAAKGGLAALYPTGSNIERSQANFFSTDTTAVMSYPPNGYGLFDMAGNVYEWCQDWYSYNAYDVSQQEPENPKGPIQGVYRVLRGGCWKGLREDLRCAHRHRNNPKTANSTYGFRCAANVK